MFVAAFFGVAAAVAIFIALLPIHSSAYKSGELRLRGSDAAPAQPKPRKLTRTDRRTIDRMLDVFVPTAVARHDVGASYDLASAELRAGMSRREWAKGTIGVYPFPAAGRHFHGWTVQDSTARDAWIQLMLFPRRHARVGPILFDIQLLRKGSHWRVNSFVPAATFAPVGAKPAVTAYNDFKPQAAGEGKTSKGGRIGKSYAFLPFAGLGLFLAAALGGGVWLKIRDRRIYRAAVDRRLPPLTMRGDDARARPLHRP